MRTPYVYVKTRCRHSSLLYGIHISNLDPDGGKIVNMSSKRMDISIQ